MATYFLTGGEGLVGYHLSKELLKNDHLVVTFDAQKHYIPFDKSKWPTYQNYRINTLKSDKLIRLRGDCTDHGWLKECLEKYKPNVIIHLAALPIAGISNSYPTEAKVNIFDTIVTLLDILRGVSFEFDRVIYTSSSMVYGNFLKDEEGKIIPASEDQATNPVGIYGAMKLSGETITRVYNHRYGIPYVIIRPSAVYGPTDCNRRVTEIFLMNALQGKGLVLDNGGKHQLDFTYIDDLIQGYMLALHSKEALGQTFNITRGEGRQIKELAEIVTELVPGTSISDSDLVPYRPNRGSLDITKARNLLGYNPEYSLEDGMKVYYDFVKNYQAPI
jgi:nucleoside-diphosphate-sugar epimerase